MQTLPEKARLADAANFVTARGNTFGAILPDQFAQRVDQFRLQVIEPLVVGTENEGVQSIDSIAGGKLRAGAVVPVRRGY